ncbi:unnamed protein product [Pseudo-nitzschia multistriata]|uniref:Uncharacterized protein n=1 Tax=Pseudo-nitzschia multistriata TaxID=183589 RepID=A0A448ZRT1_9STRA|nr:unnamed protein product [Pseudo-nitzschia multistriata]
MTEGSGSNDSDAPSGCLLLDFLPRELLAGSILARFLDGRALANFWCATMSKREMLVRRSSPRKLRSKRNSPLSMVEEILQVARYRRAKLTEDGAGGNDEDENENQTDSHRFRLRSRVFMAFEEAAETKKATGNDADRCGGSGEKLGVSERDTEHHFNLAEFLRLSRRTFASLSAMDYCETVAQNLIWTGVVTIRGVDHRKTTIWAVLVVDPWRWSMKEIRLWRNASTSRASACSTSAAQTGPPAIEARVVPHNFLPVGPNRGRLVGVTEADRIALGRISADLSESGLVARFSCVTTNTGAALTGNAITDTNSDHRNANSGGQFTVKLMAFDQAQEKLDTVFRRGREPGGIPLSDEKKGMSLDLDRHRKKALGGAKQQRYPQVDTNNSCIDYGSDLELNHDDHSLLCCWSHEFLWEESRNFAVETSHALRYLANDYAALEW